MSAEWVGPEEALSCFQPPIQLSGLQLYISILCKDGNSQHGWMDREQVHASSRKVGERVCEDTG